MTFPTHNYGDRMRGDTLTFTCDWKETGVPVNLTGYTVRVAMQNSTGQQVTGFDVTVTPLLGRVAVVVPAALSERWAPGTYTFDISYEIANTRRSLLRYTFNLIASMTG